MDAKHVSCRPQGGHTLAGSGAVPNRRLPEAYATRTGKPRCYGDDRASYANHVAHSDTAQYVDARAHADDVA